MPSNGSPAGAVQERRMPFETYVVRRLQQARLLTDPFKLRLLEQFAAAPVTTKQVADRLGEKAPRLYRHVEALAGEGLLELIAEKPKRGTVERYYRAVAAHFEIDPQLFATTGVPRRSTGQAVRALLRDVEADLMHACRAPGDDGPGPSRQPLVMRLAFRATPEQAQCLRDRIDAWLRECDAPDDERIEAYTGLFAVYPRRGAE
jgi:DNA-binding transcriptional ArsR family regulator